MHTKDFIFRIKISFRLNFKVFFIWCCDYSNSFLKNLHKTINREKKELYIIIVKQQSYICASTNAYSLNSNLKLEI